MPPQLVGIQILRGLAALLVVFNHYNGAALAHGFGWSALDGVVFGNFGVDVFFVISGFIMELTAGGRPFKAGDRRRFLLRRAVRVLPIYWLLTSAAFLATLAYGASINSKLSISDYLLSMLLLPATGADGEAKYVIGVAWSLSYEIYFYGLFAVLLPLTERQRLGILALFFGASVMFGIWLQPKSPVAHILVEPILFEFLAGCWLANLYRTGVGLSRPMAAFVLLAAIAMMALQFKQTYPAGLRAIFWGVPATLLVCGVVLAPGRASPAASRPFVHLGDISYSLYLSHFFTLAVFVRLWAKWPLMGDGANAAAAIAVFGMCIAAAHLCWRWLENPLRRQAGALVDPATRARTAARTNS